MAIALASLLQEHGARQVDLLAMDTKFTPSRYNTLIVDGSNPQALALVEAFNQTITTNQQIAVSELILTRNSDQNWAAGLDTYQERCLVRRLTVSPLWADRLVARLALEGFTRDFRYLSF